MGSRSVDGATGREVSSTNVGAQLIAPNEITDWPALAEADGVLIVPTGAAPNLCYAGGNCIVDSDCGPGGWCSPSGGAQCESYALCADAGLASPGTTGTAPSVGCWESSNDGGSWTATACLCGDACGQAAYYCHTACDVCVNDSDCSPGSCEYDVHNGIWDCFDVLNPQ